MLKGLYNFIMEAFGCCQHPLRSWPRRDPSDGQDYQYCFHCHLRIKSRVQFNTARVATNADAMKEDT